MIKTVDKCLYSCPDRTFISSVNVTSNMTTCEPCFEGCTHCYASYNQTCSACDSNHVLLNNTCFSKCGEGKI